MRDIPPSVMNHILLNPQGLEPVNIVQIWWTDKYSVLYADKRYSEYKVFGNIVELTNLENVANFDKSGASSSVSVTLSDTDGSIKKVYNTTDIHKKKVIIYQWFTSLHIEQKFVLFEGHINTPIVWKEGDRTLSFEVVSKLEDMETGFSVEEGAFQLIPDELIGKPWPLPFGTACHIPVVKLDAIPTGGTLDHGGAVDPTLAQQKDKLGQEGSQLGAMATLMFSYAALMYYNAHQDENGGFNLDTVDQQFQGLGDQYTQQGNQYLAQLYQAQNEISNHSAMQGAQQSAAGSSIGLANGDQFPQGSSVGTNLGGVAITGTIGGGSLQIDQALHPASQGDAQNIQMIPLTSSVAVGDRQDQIIPAGFAYFPPGLPFHLTTDLPVRYIVAMLPCHVLNVWAWRSFYNQKALVPVPTLMWGAGTLNLGTIVATIVVLPKPLSYYEMGWEDDIFVDIQSPIGPNIIDIMEWLIQTYSTLGIDATSFDKVRKRVEPFPCNFALFDRKNIVQLLSEIAYQARIGLWLKNDKFYVQYLPDMPAAVETITEKDILLNSLEIDCTATEDIITKLTASYKPDYATDRQGYVVLRNNIPKYGLYKEDEDWYIYTNMQLVDLAATYWIIRKSNTWKIIKFRTPLTKLKLETFDGVKIAFTHSYVSNKSFIGRVQSCHFDSDKLEIEFEVWCPIRLGEMEVYHWAYPVDDDVHTYQGNLQIATGYSQANGPVGSTNGAQGISTKEDKGSRKSWTSGNPNPGTENVGGQSIVAPEVSGLDTSARPRFDYQYSNRRVLPPNIVDPNKPITVPGQILTIGTQDKSSCKVAMYLQGIANKATNAIARNVDPNRSVNVGDWVMVSVVVWIVKDSNGNPITKADRYFLPSSSTPGAYPGVIMSGSGDTYTVQTYKKGLSGQSENLTVKQLQIDRADTIPIGTWVLVVEANVVSTLDGSQSKKYYMQVPVYLE